MPLLKFQPSYIHQSGQLIRIHSEMVWWCVTRRLAYKFEQGPIFLDQVICALPAPTASPLTSALTIRQLHILAAHTHYRLNRLQPFHNITFHKAVSGWMRTKIKLHCCVSQTFMCVTLKSQMVCDPRPYRADGSSQWYLL